MSGLASAGVALGLGLGALGMALLVLADGRRGIAGGAAGAALGLALVQLAGGAGAAAGVTAVAGLLGALASLRGEERRGWDVLPPGSSPRIVLCVVLGGAALWFGSRWLGSPGQWSLRALAALVVALAGARAVTSREIGVGLPAAALVVLAAGALAVERGGGVPAQLVAGLLALFLNLLPLTFTAVRQGEWESRRGGNG